VQENLKLSFPDKNPEELKEIEYNFFKHFTDLFFVEMVKSFSISKKEVAKRYQFENIELINGLFKDGKSVILMLSHHANWEWVVSIQMFVPEKAYGAYARIKNKYFNRKMLTSRGRFGSTLIGKNDIVKEVARNKINGVLAVYGLISDQSPMVKNTRYWGSFFNNKVPVHFGAEMLAKRHNFSVVFMETKRVKRGFYSTKFSLITHDAKNTNDQEITDAYLRRLEQVVTASPELYLWSHNRFKHKDKAELFA
jgi:KDO2-lipid IV(A) lauroyltransferase